MFRLGSVLLQPFLRGFVFNVKTVPVSSTLLCSLYYSPLQNRSIIRTAVASGIPMSLLHLALGIYIGIFVAQNFDIPKIPPPDEMIATVKVWLEERKKSS
uniref:Uncharacterized protein n=1 Tax=Trichuris muris TaxID=70415 RepID=A0A5S6R0V5_TRIMR